MKIEIELIGPQKKIIANSILTVLKNTSAETGYEYKLTNEKGEVYINSVLQNKIRNRRIYDK